jgi:hypothetical protein
MNSGPLSTMMLLRQAAVGGELLERRDHPYRRQRGIDVDPRTFAREFIDHREAAKPPTANAGVMDEIHAPALVRLRRRQQWDAGLGGAFAGAVRPHQQPFFAVEAIHPLEIHDDALASQEHLQPLVAKAWPVRRQLLQVARIGASFRGRRGW